MSIKNFLVKLKEYIKSEEFNQIKTDENRPVILPERGFVVLKEEPYFVRFDKEFHNDNLLTIIDQYLPTHIDLKKELKKDLNVCLYYLLDCGVIIFENHGLISMNEYQKNPTAIYRSTGELYLPNNISNITGIQASILLKYMEDFKCLGKLDIIEATGKNLKNQTYSNLLLCELEESLKMLRDQDIRRGIMR